MISYSFGIVSLIWCGFGLFQARSYQLGMDLAADHVYVIAEHKAKSEVGIWYEHKDFFFIEIWVFCV